jgi:phage terminase small subunit
MSLEDEKSGLRAIGSDGKMLAFVQHYMVHRNGAKAAVEAGYSAKTANKIAYRLLKDPRVGAELEKRLANVEKDTRISAKRVLDELADIAYLTQAGQTAYKAADRITALSLIGKHLGLFKERMEVSGPDGAPIPTSLKIEFVRSDGDGMPNPVS